jgi:amidase
MKSIVPSALALALVLSPAFSSAQGTGGYPVAEKSVAELQADLTAGKVTSVELVEAYLDRIERIDRTGPALHSVIVVNPQALVEARRADAARKAGSAHGALFGIPVLIKDNIESNDGTATTAGSDALRANVTHRDAPLVAKMKAAGAIVLGKTNLSEWANIRSDHSISGWSAVGGLVKNPYALDRNACGSSSGTGAAIAASLAAVGVGTETDGSITCPSSINGLVGLKPTVGLVSRTHVVPISHSQDTPGPMGRSVADVAALLDGIAGSDPADPQTANADEHKVDYLAALKGASLKGKHLGIFKTAAARGDDPIQDALFDHAVKVLQNAGATVVAIGDYKPDRRIGAAEGTVLFTELKADLNAYLKTTPPTVKYRTLAELIAFNKSDPRELGLFQQEGFERGEKTKGLDDKKYLAAAALAKRLAGPEGIDTILARHHIDAIVMPSYGPSPRTDIVTGDHISGGSSGLAAVAGYPHLTVPMGYEKGMPVGISFIGGAWTEAKLLQLGAAYEAASHERKAPTYPASIEGTAPYAALLAPEKP